MPPCDNSDGSSRELWVVVSAMWCVYSSGISSQLLKSEIVDSDTNDVLLDRALRMKIESLIIVKEIYFFSMTIGFVSVK